MLTCPHCKNGFYPQDAMINIKEEKPDYGKWRENGWWGIFAFGMCLGFINDASQANLVRDNIVKRFIADGLSGTESAGFFNEHLFHSIKMEVFKQIKSTSLDRKIGCAAKSINEIRKVLTESGEFFEKKREKLIDNSLEVIKAPTDFQPYKKNIIEGNLPSDIAYIDSKGRPIKGGEENKEKGEQAINQFSKNIIESEIKKQTLKEKGLDPEKLADDSEQYFSKEYEEQLEKECEEMERKEQERWDSLTDEERKAEEDFWDNYNKEFDVRELEKQNRPKRNRSEITSDEIEMMAEMDPEEREEYLNYHFEKESQLRLSKRAASFWTKPVFEKEIGEILRVAEEETISFDLLKRSFMHGILRPLDKKIWEHLDNTDSLNVRSLEDAITLAENYGKDWKPIKEAFENQRSLPAPIVLELDNGAITLVGGNTRLAFAKAYHVKPEVYWIKETELF